MPKFQNEALLYQTFILRFSELLLFFYAPNFSSWMKSFWNTQEAFLEARFFLTLINVLFLQKVYSGNKITEELLFKQLHKCYKKMFEDQIKFKRK